MLLLPTTREEIVHLLPSQGRAAEVGVAEGEFSQVMLDQGVRELCLIDPWIQQRDPAFAHDPNNIDDDHQEARYQAVVERFSGCPAVTIHRQATPAAAALFPDGYFDWVYLDARKSYEEVLEDLTAWSAKLAANGWLLGHDYACHQAAAEMGFGVVQAVEEFVQRGEFTLFAITAEAYPTYMLARPASMVSCSLAEILVRYPGAVRLAGDQAMTQQLVQDEGGRFLVSSVDHRFLCLTSFAAKEA